MTLATIEAPTNGHLAPRIPQEAKIVQDDGPLSYLFDTARFEHLQRIAKLMAHAAFTPKHLRGNSNEEALANCFRVTLQAVRWGFDPFAVADETYVVSGKLGYQGKLVAAVVNARAGLADRLSFKFEGQGDGRTITVSGRFQNEAEPRTISLSVGQAKTQHQMWRSDPDQKLVYSGTVKWARRHCQEVIMGVLTDDDVEIAAANSIEPANTPTAAKSLEAALARGAKPAPSVTVKAIDPDSQIPVDEQFAAEPHVEPEPPPVEESQIPDVDVSDMAAFREALEGYAFGKVNPPSAFDAIFTTLTLRDGVKSGRRGVYEAARREILKAAAEGRIDWSTGKIKD